ncbi:MULTISPECIES: hypothetical protein [Idiomarinaceae]|uniref:Lipoprotein n=4 Tax=Pseudidiomarina TaxID=2800384 RepID=A0A368UQI3_9GAMM|nr:MULTISPECIES: hypothetical protein [Idiomarinaceae]MDT7526948.1 hypothetical protein [Pseudidiomarina sp. GXY010]MRJ40665.1 hypothetical protein [Idiomarina sp. FeN1]NCU58613.1 hypothetical protein [Idiomarina sp. FenA--70]NCU61310.1 hypothetical protein [Idiomarina sp. FenBw--71]PWW07913.1 hypothetical protein DET45_12418 [Pseudidiomarina maritima]
MKILFLVAALTLTAACNADTNRLKECGVTIDKSYDGKNGEFVEFVVNIDSNTNSRKCSEISEITLSNFKTGEWVIFPLPKKGAEVSLRIRKASIDYSVLNLIFRSTKIDDVYFDEKNSIKIYLSDF